MCFLDFLSNLLFLLAVRQLVWAPLETESCTMTYINLTLSFPLHHYYSNILTHAGNSVRKSLQTHDQVNSLVTAVRAFENKFADALLHQHSAVLQLQQQQQQEQQMRLQQQESGGASPTKSNTRGNTTVITSSAAGMHVNGSGGGSGNISLTAGHSQLKGNDDSSSSATTTATATASAQQEVLLAERTALLSESLQGYVGAEARCIKFLADRVNIAMKKSGVLRKELLAYTALSMKVKETVKSETA